ncbi:MAG: protein translocase subunit SecD [bacterium]
MWKKRIGALVLLVIAVGIGYFVYWSEVTGKRPFKLGLDLSGGTYLLYKVDVSKIDPKQIPDIMDSLPGFIEKRISQKETAGALGVLEANIHTETTSLAGNQVEYRVGIELPGVTDVKKAEDIIGKAPFLEFKVENPDYKKIDGKDQVIELDETAIKNGTLDLSTALEKYSPYKSIGFTGQYLANADLQFDPNTHAPSVGLTFNDEGAKLFEKLTGENIGKTIAIYLDGQLIESPRVNQKISGGKAVISGNFTPVTARDLVNNLNHGALPVPISPISTDVIGPTLGSHAVNAGILAGLIGLIAIAVLLIVWYRLPGFIATLTLGIYGVVMLALFKLIPVTLTSAGIAGFIISLGMAVDASILIFERVKEEMHTGKSIPESIHLGFDRAWNAIRDGNISSLISAAVLFFLGTTLIKGFAVTFGLGVLVSMGVIVVVSRAFLYVVAGLGNGRIKRFLFSSGFSK